VRTLSFASKQFGSDLAVFCHGAAVSQEISASVTAILSDIRARGDAAVAHYALRFDGAKLKPREFRVGDREIALAERRLAAAGRTALESAHAAVSDFARRTLPANWNGLNRHGARVGEKFDPIRRVGIYVPGGEVPLVSTVLMTATLAVIAGCPEIAVFTPSGADGRIAPDLLAALRLTGIREVYRIGGVHAIGAMAYGTATIPAVDKIFGPGNAFVCEAKRQVFGTVGIDLLPGPSELMVIADESARLDYAAADLLAQAEHGSGRERIYLVATSPRVIAGVAAEIKRQVGGLTRSEKTQRVLDNGFLAVEVADLAQAAEVANKVAPEHLELLVRGGAAETLVKRVVTAGAIMVGNSTPTALGDFTAGPSHVLPTGGAGRFSSGLRVSDFLRRTSVVRYDSRSVRVAEPTVAAFSSMERLDAHGRSVAIRVSRPGSK
jgi:histidinol dehydrogenase